MQGPKLYALPAGILLDVNLLRPPLYIRVLGFIRQIMQGKAVTQVNLLQRLLLLQLHLRIKQLLRKAQIVKIQEVPVVRVNPLAIQTNARSDTACI